MKQKENATYIKLGITGAAILLIGLVFFFFFYRIQYFSNLFQHVLSILKPFIYGIVIAYLLAPACNKIENLLRRLFRKDKKQIPALAILLCMLLAVLVLWALFMMVIPQVSQSILDIMTAIPGQLDTTISWIEQQLQNRPEWKSWLMPFFEELDVTLQSWMQTDLLPTVQTVLNGLGGRIAILIASVKNITLGIMISIYLLGSRKKFAVQAKMILYGCFPERWADKIEEEVRYADRMFSGFLIGKVIDSAIIGVICFIATYLMGFPSALLISVIIGVTNIIPFFGPFIGAIPCVLLLLLENPLHSLYFIIFIILLQQADGNIIGPKILGDTTGLSGFWVLFAILVFGGLWGFAGMIAGVPLFAVIYDILRRIIYFLLKRRGRQRLVQEYTVSFREQTKQAGQHHK